MSLNQPNRKFEKILETNDDETTMMCQHLWDIARIGVEGNFTAMNVYITSIWGTEERTI